MDTSSSGRDPTIFSLSYVVSTENALTLGLGLSLIGHLDHYPFRAWEDTVELPSPFALIAETELDSNGDRSHTILGRVHWASGLHYAIVGDVTP